MSMKKFDLEKQSALKIDGKMKSAGVKDRFAQGASASTEKREQRRRDSAAGLVPFACKLPASLVAELTQRAPAHAGGVAGLVEELLRKGLA